MISTQPRSARRGFSLIEVAIALVIFVIGALAIIRIFPGALKVIGNNGNQQVATNLNRDVTARLKTDDSVPGQTFNIAINNDGSLHWTTEGNTNHTADYIAAATPPIANNIGNRGDIPASVIGVPRFNASLPTTEDINTQANNSALSRFRGIIGEQAKVLTINQGGTNVQYATTQFPISIQGVGAALAPLAPTISQEYIVQNARINKQKQVVFTDATTDVAGQQVSLSDAVNNTTKNDLPAGSMIYISYRYLKDANNDGRAEVWGVKEEAIPVTTALRLRTDNDPSPVTVIVNPPTTTKGTYEDYDTTDQTTMATTGTVTEVMDVRVKRIVGAGLFNGANNEEKITKARCGLVELPSAVTTNTVSVDYVADWSWLMQKGTPLLTPEENPTTALTGTRLYRQIALGAPFIEDQAPVGIYSLLLEPSATPQIYTLAASRFGTQNSAPDPTTGALAAPNANDLKTGKVTFSVANSESRARVAYRTRDSWVQQLSVAASAYKPFVAGNAEPWRDYILGLDNYLYFHAGEAGKTISVSYSYNDVEDAPAAATPLADKNIVSKPFVIESQLIDAASVTLPAGFVSTDPNTKVARVQLLTAQGKTFPDIKNGATINLASIQSVRGTSVTVRTAYLNGDKYAQTLLTSNRGTN